MNLLKNDTFRKKFIDTFCIMGGSIFRDEKVKEIVTEMRNYLNQGGWVNSTNTANTLTGTFSSSYNGNMVNHLKNYKYKNSNNPDDNFDFGLSSTTRQAVTLSTNIDEGKILINGIEVPYSDFNGYLFAPVTLQAVAPAGYRFAGWTSKGPANQKTIFSQGALWKYYDAGSLDGADWTVSTYDDSGWSSGNATIGYDYNNQHPDIVTTTAGNKSCYYFRKTFTLTTVPNANDEFTLDCTIDDGMVVYVNGQEVGRYNMPDGDINYSTLAKSYAPANPDNTTITFKGSLCKRGSNIIAVEVHNNNTTSTDIMWDASLLAEAQEVENLDYVSTETEYEMPSNGVQKLVAVFDALPAEEMLAENITPVRVNEISAANSMYINDYFKKNDWVELYNTTDKDIDIAGMYISDNAEKSQKYQVPTDDVNLNTIITAHGYKVIWCDKLDNIGADIHTSFKLASEGGDLIITTDTYADTLHYDTHLGTQSFGRYPDGCNDTYVMNQPTIAKANQIGSYDTLYIKPINPEPEPDAIRSYKKEGSITIAYAGGVINVKSEDSPIRSIDLFNSSGMKMNAAQSARNGEHFISVPVASLPKGIYIVSAITQSGDECHIKFFVR